MSIIRFTILGRIGAKGRPRFVRATGRAYTDAKTQGAEALVRHFAAQAIHGADLLTGAVRLEIKVYQTPPASWSRKRREAARHVTGRPDCDNQAKLISDACNGIVWIDDAQISTLIVEREYTIDGPERVEVSVYDLSQAPWTHATPCMETREAAE